MERQMQTMNATEVRKNWSHVCDDVARVKPSFIRRTHDNYFLASREYMLQLLAPFKYQVDVVEETDGSCTGVVAALDLAENAPNRARLEEQLADAILEYAEEYYDAFPVYANAPNRADHIPYITKALLLGTRNQIRGELECRNGES